MALLGQRDTCDMRRFGVGRDSCQWLLDFVDDGRCQLTDQCKSGGMCEFEPRQCQLSLSLLEVGDVAAGAQHGATVNRHTLEMNEDVPALAVLGGDLALHVLDLAPGVEIGRIEQVFTEEGAKPSDSEDFVRRESENHVDIGAHEGELPRVVRHEDRVGDIAQRCAVQLFRCAQGFKGLRPAAVPRAIHVPPPAWCCKACDMGRRDTTAVPQCTMMVPLQGV